MSHIVNDQIMDNIVNDITDKLDAQDEKTWEIYNDVASEYGYHPDDDSHFLITKQTRLLSMQTTSL